MNTNIETANSEFLPSASLEMLRLRAELLTAVREFFNSRGYWEVETPILSHETVVDAHLEPFVVADPFQQGTALFLQTSPEFGMKRLLSAGAEAIFQITKAFRRDEKGKLHNPEFTMIEWYRVGDTPDDQMTFVEELVSAVFEKAASRKSRSCQIKLPFKRTSYDEAFARHAGTRVLHLCSAELIELARSHEITLSNSFLSDDRDALLNFLLAEIVEPELGKEGPEFLYDYPASQSALARVRQENPPVAERFELYIGGIELCNGYHELTDADEFERRCAEQAEIRASLGNPELPTGKFLADAMKHHSPNCTGVALGFDRLAMLAVGASSLAEVMAFPFERA